MLPPDPPYLEVGVYDAVRSDEETLQRFLDCLVAQGARATGRGRALRGIGPTDVFEGPTDGEPVEVRISRLEGVHDLVRPDERLVEVELTGGIGAPRHFDRLTYLRVERSFLATDRHPVALWGSGEAFSGPPSSRTRAVGRRARELFEAVVGSLDPAYGALTIDWPLGSPGQIAADPRSWGDYRDFYVSRSYVGPGVIDRIGDAAAGLDVRRTQKGIFVFSSAAFGGSDQDHEAAGKAFTAALAQTWRRRAGTPDPP